MSKNRKKKVVPVAVIKAGPVFNYTSECCGVRAKKPPVERSAADKAEGKFSECALGSWRCSQCTKPCKVKRSKVKETDGESGTAVQSQ